MSANVCENCGKELPVAGTGSCVACAANFDDDRPYVMDDAGATQPCCQCRKPLPRGAILCNHCGCHQETGEQLQRVYKKVDREWESGLTFRTRLIVFLSVQGAALAATVVVALVDGNLPGLLLSWLIGVAMLAFVLGTYSRINLRRNKQGNVRLTKTWRCCFFSLGDVEVRWRQHVGVSLGQAPQSDMIDWIVLFLLAPWGLIPAILWWRYVLSGDQFDVTLTMEHGSPALILYRGHDQDKARDMAITLRAVTGLR